MEIFDGRRNYQTFLQSKENLQDFFRFLSYGYCYEIGPFQTKFCHE
jgi:hypothetical protein